MISVNHCAREGGRQSIPYPLLRDRRPTARNRLLTPSEGVRRTWIKSECCLESVDLETEQAVEMPSQQRSEREARCLTAPRVRASLQKQYIPLRLDLTRLLGRIPSDCVDT